MKAHPTLADRPWMTALNMQFSTLSVVRRLVAMPDMPRSITDNHVMAHLAQSAPFTWSRETSSAVWTASQSIPDDASFSADLLPDGMRHAFWWLEQPLALPMKNPQKLRSNHGLPDGWDGLDTEHICCILLSLRDDDTWTVSCGRMSHEIGVPFMIEANIYPVGLDLKALLQPDAYSFDALLGRENKIRARDISLARFILAASVWLKQRVVTIGSGHVERHSRKKLARDFGVDVSEVKVIELRKAESRAGETDGSPDTEWSCRWIVNGHWRNQWHPSTQKHELQYILPYVKGPDDKPLKVPKAEVFVVRR